MSVSQRLDGGAESTDTLWKVPIEIPNQQLKTVEKVQMQLMRPKLVVIGKCANDHLNEFVQIFPGHFRPPQW